MKISHYLLAVSLVCFSCKKETTKASQPEKKIATTSAKIPFINPPLKDFKLPKETVLISTKKEKSITFKNGETLVIPKNAFIDKAGNTIEGEVEIGFKSFNDPLEIFLSGIPMQMESNGETYQLESEKMFEITANQNKTPVFINPDKNLTLSVPTIKDAEIYKFIKLDTASKNWILNEDAEIETIKNTSPSEEEIVLSPKDLANLKFEIAKISIPLKPRKITEGSYRFEIELPSYDLFPELKPFKNTVYEVHKSDTVYKPEHAKIIWDGYKLSRTNRHNNVYNIQFYNRLKKVTYRVIPAYEGDNFDEAIKAYEKAIKKREALAKKIKQDYINQQLNTQKENLKSGKTNLNNEIRRTFQINNLGVFNIDRLFKFKGNEVKITLLDQNKNEIETAFSLVYKSINSVFKCHTSNQIKVMEKEDIKIWTSINNQLAFASLNGKSIINNPNKEITLQLTLIKEKITSPDQLRKLLGL